MAHPEWFPPIKETVGELLEDLADTIDTEFYLEDARKATPSKQ